MEEVGSTPKMDTLCKVCGDKASGKHYGVSSCDGCRGFFKRSIRRNMEYVCKENGHCVVDVTRRNQCQACRFKKCLHVNMKRDAVQHERAPRTSTIPASIHHYPIGLSRFRPLHFAPLTPNFPLDSTLPPFNSHYLPMYPTLLGGRIFRTGENLQPVLNFQADLCNSNCKLGVQKQVEMLNSTLSARNVKDDEVSSSEEIARQKTLDEDSNPEEYSSSLDLPLISDTCKSNKSHQDLPSLNLFPHENMYETALKLLYLSVKWARTIPSFLQLSLRDQSILLEESWNELFVLTAAQWSFPVDEAIIISNAVVQTSRQICIEDDARKLREIIVRLNTLRVDHTEHACLKALVLFKSECRGLYEPTHIELLQDQTHIMLHEYCMQKQNHRKGRFGKLLLTLLGVQAISRRGLEELLFRQTIGDVAIDRLLRDIERNPHQ